jgi:hypothetical protein
MLDGYFRLSRPLADLATVFDMCGFGSKLAEDGLVLERGDLVLQASRLGAEEYRLHGELPEHASDIAGQVALALEADGIAFQLDLYAASGERIKRFTPAG